MVNFADIAITKSCIDQMMSQSPYHFSKETIKNYIQIHQGYVDEVILDKILSDGKYHKIRVHNSGENYCAAQELTHFF